jgi:hypothetical protein
MHPPPAEQALAGVRLCAHRCCPGAAHLAPCAVLILVQLRLRASAEQEQEAVAKFVKQTANTFAPKASGPKARRQHRRRAAPAPVADLRRGAE